MHYQNKILLRVLTLFAALIGLSALACGVLFQSQYDQSLRFQLEQLERVRDANVEALEDEVSAMGRLLLAMKLELIGSGHLAPGQPVNREALEAFFRPYFEMSHLLSQLRWLDPRGQEQARLNRDPGGVSASERLQDKSERYYFREALDSPSGDVHVSQIDLNIENGAIVQPYEPTVRLSIGTGEAEGLRRGVLVMNFNLAALFEAIYASIGEGQLLRLFDRRGALLIDTGDAGGAWQSLIEMTRGTSSEHAVDLQDLEGGSVEPLSGLIEEGPRQYLVAVEFTQDYRQQLLKQAARAPIWLFVGLAVLSAAICAYIFRYERRLESLNGLLANQVAQLRQSSDYKSRFFSNMSHEIRTPLTAIIGLVELMDRNRDPAFIDRNMPVVMASANSLLSLINDILDVSRVEAGGMHLENVPVLINELIDKSFLLFAGDADNQALRLVSEVDDELFEVPFYGDPLRLSQVLNNLIGNAIKFTNEGVVRVAVSLVDASETVGSVEVEVEDTGIGMSEEVQARIGKAFEQGESVIARRYGGSGLGLVITQQLLELMGSTLEFESTEGQGSRFHFRLSLAVASRGRQVSKARLHSLPERVMVVDKNQKMQELLRHWFEARGVMIDCFDSVREAVDAYAATVESSNAYQYVLMDVGSEGLAFARKLDLIANNADREPLGKLLIVSDTQLSNLGELGDIAQLTTLAKPISMSAVIDALGAQVVEKRRLHGADDKHQALELLMKQLRTRLQRTVAPRILVVDDNSYNQVLLHELFVSFGLDVVLVDSGAAAVEQVNRSRFDLVFMDIQMPEMNGYEATKAIRRRFDADELPVVAISAASFQDDIERARDSGMNDHIAKPISTVTLLQTILKYWRPRAAEPRAPAEAPAQPGDAGSHPGPVERLFLLDDFQPEETVYPMIGAAAYIRVAEAFVKGVEKDMVGWRRGPLDGAAKRRLVHKLVGAAGTVGAVALAQLTAETRQALRQDEGASVEALLDKTEETVAQLKSILELS
ncbi:response regulator [Spongiibacter taiwanensis]|uniref:hybrid sensor histidine kinase/response regulator n=1 Tax=Spongiibacter taiwanensis TaxID=1748242 RepID=UPI002034B7AD|nr:response regulator [Spongiibacter taiwanensis]USA44480.1 response regulator [Spongiibacter taiwanensis]